MNTKANLKAAREAIAAKNFDEAVKACNRVLLWESGNYNAWVFLGVAYTGLENDQEAEKSYRQAIELNGESLLAWQGLINLYEKRKRYSEMASTIESILPKVAQSNDGNRLADYLDKLVNVYKDKEETQDEYIETLKLFLPESPYYDVIKDTKFMRRPIDIWTIITERTEQDQAKMIESRVHSQRYNVNAGPLEQVRERVMADVYAQSKLGEMYQKLLELADDDNKKQAIQVKLLDFWYKRLPGVSEKAELYQNICSLAKSLVEANVDAPLPYEILIETADTKSLEQYDRQLLDNFADRFPDTGLAKLIHGYRLYSDNQIDAAFDLFSEGLELSPNSLYGYRCLCWIYYECKEYETGLEYATKGRDLVRKRAKETGKLLSSVLLSMELCMAHCYRCLDTKYYPDAMGLYKKILSQESDEIGALEGAGLILREEDNYEEALSLFEKVYQLDPKRHIALAEIGWIYCEKQEYERAIEYIMKAIEQEEVAEYHYRLGRIYWAMGGEYRTSTAFAFKHLMQSVKLNSQFSSGFTFLGHFYRQVQKDHVRAKKCYQKAFLLNPQEEVDAALHLSDYYIADNEATDAEEIFKRVTELAPKTGWAWRRLGYAKMNAGKFADAIGCFQKALRRDTSDVRCWEGLGEAYAHEGRYVAALKAFGRAIQLDGSSIHANYQMSLVKQKIGLLDEAIAGFKHTLGLAESQDKPNYLPAIKGLGDSYLEKVKEEIQQGFFARAAASAGEVIRTALVGLEQDRSLISFWKLIGDACAIYRHVPTYVHLCAYAELQKAMSIIIFSDSSSPHARLGFSPEHDPCAGLFNEFMQLDITENFNLPSKVALDVVLVCASFAYKNALVLCRNHKQIAPAFWHDLALVYYWMSENNRSDEVDSYTEMAIGCACAALKMEPSQYLYWNTLGVIAMRGLPKISQYALVKAMEFNSRSAVPWTNYGFLCLIQQDYELANHAFETAHALDPEWVSAWVGQAYVSSLWGTTEAASSSSNLFQHAFESSSRTSLEASYGYAETVFNQLSNMPEGKADMVELVVPPAFALQKLTEQKLNGAHALNLLGLLLERMGHFERASEAFAGAILALEAQLEQGVINEKEAKERTAKAHANLGRTLCACGNFEGAISSYHSVLGQEQETTTTMRIYCQLGAGIAYYFEDRLEDSLAMFEAALNETESNPELRLDVTVLLAKVLWALGGDEQRAVAKDQLFSSISDNPNYLPAIFSLCVMGILEDDETLTNAALQELGKVSMDTAYEMDKQQWIPWLFSRFYQLQDKPELAMRSLAKSLYQTPWLYSAWNRLASNVLLMNDESNKQQKRLMTSASLTMTNSSKMASADAKAEAYEHAVQATSDDEASKTAAKRLAQRAVMIAPWRLSAWKTLASTN